MKSSHWAKQKERGTLFFLTITRIIVKHFPLPVIRFITLWVVFYFFITSFKSRKNIAEYQQKLTACFPDTKLPKWPIFQQFLSFGEAITDRFAVWQKQIRYQDLIIDDTDNLYEEMNKNGRGQILLCSHLGNIEICRALVNSGHHKNFHLSILVHSHNAEAFNKALVEAGADELSLIQVQDLNPQKMLELAERIEQGEWIAIAADRTPLQGDKTTQVEFLGDLAYFPQGAWLLASLLKTPINTVFCLKQQGTYRLKLRRFCGVIQGRGKIREQKIQHAIQQYSDLLAKECANAPLLWFNFYSFWH